VAGIKKNHLQPAMTGAKNWIKSQSHHELTIFEKSLEESFVAAR
jgi:hypothetical protein